MRVNCEFEEVSGRDYGRVDHCNPLVKMYCSLHISLWGAAIFTAHLGRRICNQGRVFPSSREPWAMIFKEKPLQHDAVRC